MLLAALRCKGHNTSNNATISMTPAVSEKNRRHGVYLFTDSSPAVES
jgi:hypothetical protein